MIDTEDENRWIELGETKAWNWQQGTMLQWLLGSQSKVIWNDRQNEQFVCCVYDVDTGEMNTLSRTVYHVSPEGIWGLSTDWSRIQHIRPGYGYVGIDDPNRDEQTPEDSGIWLVNMVTGESEFILSIAYMFEFQGDHPREARHYFNHIQWYTEWFAIPVSTSVTAF